MFGVNERVRLQCPKTKLWNIRGKVHGLRFSEAGSIVSYDIMLENGNVTSRHHRFMTKDIPEVESQAVLHDEEADIHEGPCVTETGHSRLEDSNITGVVTRSKKKMLANSARGKFRGESRKVS